MRRTLALSILLAVALVGAASAQPELQTEVLSRVVPVVGSTPGTNNSFFRTGLQMRNAGNSALSGRFVYHPANGSSSPSDPSLSFDVPAGGTISYADIVDEMGISGLGSLDLLLPPASASPVIVTRVFNDAGATGTSGFNEEAVDPSERGAGSPVLTGTTLSVLVAPSDLTRFRYNIGARSLSSGVGMTIIVRDASGEAVHIAQKSLDPNYFAQQTASQFLGTTLEPNDSIEFRIERGSVILYGATTDNLTNDPSFQYARVVLPTP
jgi:hypothetical protein